MVYGTYLLTPVFVASRWYLLSSRGWTQSEPQNCLGSDAHVCKISHNCLGISHTCLGISYMCTCLGISQTCLGISYMCLGDKPPLSGDKPPLSGDKPHVHLSGDKPHLSWDKLHVSGDKPPSGDKPHLSGISHTYLGSINRTWLWVQWLCHDAVFNYSLIYMCQY